MLTIQSFSCVIVVYHRLENVTWGLQVSFKNEFWGTHWYYPFSVQNKDKKMFYNCYINLNPLSPNLRKAATTCRHINYFLCGTNYVNSLVVSTNPKKKIVWKSSVEL